jgi:hypothetical protein
MSETPQPNGRGDELGLTGPGVAHVKIPEVDVLVDRYVAARDKRMDHTKKEVEAKANLVAALHANADAIGRDPDGVIVYHYDDLVVTLATGKEKLKVRTADEEEE